jgi:hypothetical protein
MIASDPPHLTPDQSKREQRVGQLATRNLQNTTTYHKTRSLWPHEPTEASRACKRKPWSLLTTSSAASILIDVLLHPSLQPALASSVGCAIICTAAYGYGYGCACSGFSGCVCSTWAVRSRIIGKRSRAHSQILDTLSLSRALLLFADTIIYMRPQLLVATNTFISKSLTLFNFSRQCLDRGPEAQGVSAARPWTPCSQQKARSSPILIGGEFDNIA